MVNMLDLCTWFVWAAPACQRSLWLSKLSSAHKLMSCCHEILHLQTRLKHDAFYTLRLNIKNSFFSLLAYSARGCRRGLPDPHIDLAQIFILDALPDATLPSFAGLGFCTAQSTLVCATSTAGVYFGQLGESVALQSMDEPLSHHCSQYK